MAVTIGTDTISDVQLRHLDRARSRISTRELARILGDVVSDREILSQEEDLHPDWIDIYEQNKDRLPRFTSSRQMASIDNFFRALQPIDSQIRSIDPSSERIAFLLGAGASAPDPSSIPTVKDLLRELLTHARRLDREQITSLVDFCTENEIGNIEDLLTAVEISDFCSRAPNVLRLVMFQLFPEDTWRRVQQYGNDTLRLERRLADAMHPDISSIAYVQDILQVLFGLLSNLMLPASPNAGHDAIVEYLKDNKSASIITTNYDCCIDLALIRNVMPFSYNIDLVNPDILPHLSDQGTPLIKLHGSLNWFYCETCQKVHLIDIQRTVEDYTTNRGEYSVISVCRECGGQKRGLLVPPHAMKFNAKPPLQPLIVKAASCFMTARLIVVVGFSFADADSYISQMLIKAMQASEDTRLMIVDPDEQVIEKTRRKFQDRIPQFDAANRILKLQGDCSELLPQFLRGELLMKAEGESTEETPIAE